MLLACALPSKLAAFLKGYAHDVPPYLVVVGVEIQILIFEVINGEGLTIFARALLRTHSRHRTNTAWVNIGKGSFFKMMHHTVFIHVFIYVLLSTWQLQTGVPVFVSVNVLCAAQWEEARIELYVVGFITLQRYKPLLVAQR